MPSEDDGHSLDSPADVEREIAILHDRLDSLKEAVDYLELVTGISPDADGPTIEELADRLDDVEETVDLLDATMPKQQRGELEKVRAILDYATDHASRGPKGARVDTGEATAAAGCSRDTALRLMDKIAANFSWADVENPGGPRPKELRVDLAGRDYEDMMADVRAHWREQSGARGEGSA